MLHTFKTDWIKSKNNFLKINKQHHPYESPSRLSYGTLSVFTPLQQWGLCLKIHSLFVSLMYCVQAQKKRTFGKILFQCVSRTQDRSHSKCNRRPRARLDRSCIQDSVSCDPPLIMTIRTVIHSDNVFVKQAADSVASHCTCCSTCDYTKQTTDDSTESGADKRADNSSCFRSCSNSDVTASSCTEKCCCTFS